MAGCPLCGAHGRDLERLRLGPPRLVAGLVDDVAVGWGQGCWVGVCPTWGWAMATRAVTVNDVLDGHVGLDLECFDRIYLNGWVPNLQVPGQVVSFLTRHLGFPIPSPAVLERIGLGFGEAVADFAAEHDIPVVRFAEGQRKVEVMRPYLERLERQGRTGVAAIGVAQEFARVFTGTTYHADEGGGDVPRFSYAKADRRVTAYYFYLVDEAFGPAFIKICAYFPYPIKIWLNGHEYAKRRAAAVGISFTGLDNGFATTDDPAGLQNICDTLTPGVIRVFCEHWWAHLPLPLTQATGPRATGGTLRCARSRSPAPSSSTRSPCPGVLRSTVRRQP
jgi:hypothetical protein